jgi:hypothetical protein
LLTFSVFDKSLPLADKTTTATTVPSTLNVTRTTTVAISQPAIELSSSVTSSSHTTESGVSSATTDSSMANSSPDFSINPAAPHYDCQYVFGAWEKFGRTTTLNKTDHEGCCSITYDANGFDTIDKSKFSQIGGVKCSGFQVIEM